MAEQAGGQASRSAREIESSQQLLATASDGGDDDCDEDAAAEVAVALRRH